MSNLDPFDLSRFLEAQADVFEDACDELKAGRKTTHWMWFMFPQVAGLGHSPMAVRYAIRSRAEARAYLTHSVLRDRLINLTNVAIHAPAASVQDLFGYPDHLKFHSSMTLFEAVAPHEPAFPRAIDRWFKGPDARTLEILRSWG
ncbi:DUF1810 domain-containing protein [Phenylobacterium sp. LH3H17]|uniref:DUF1810 domain-containing protein n=1 Tax=Phenylobacterium sp. LH3H17 TaxID=2903901 RepID=UPI0020C9463B|nr:DUF1810 domain-containing protein [Phenylobacterium sp. LH3H17]UTP40282.1 DUF1810 domain-containing protein [Phenylobacterium sp. LH3H17]